MPRVKVGWLHRNQWRSAVAFLRATWRWVVIVGAFALAGTWLGLHWIPGWYRPSAPDAAQVQASRIQAAELVDAISDRIVAGRPFTLDLDEADMNGILASLTQIWPDATVNWPKAVRQPMLSFDAGRLRIGFEIVRNDDRGIVTIDLLVTPSPNASTLNVRLEHATLGALPLPRAVISREMAPWLARAQAPDPRNANHSDAVGAALRDVSDVSQLLSDGLTLSNHFIWPNGRRRFRVTSVEFSGGTCRLGIEPL